MKIKILKETKDFLVLDKPAGVVVHADGKEVKDKKRIQETVADFILKKYPKLKSVGESLPNIPKPGIVHRLDKDTTGCLIVAKNQDSYLNLKSQFQNHKIKKEYVALVWGFVKQDTGIIDEMIARSKTDFRKKEIVKLRMGENQDNVTYRGEGREALTRYKVLERKEIFGQKVTLITFFPQTGRTHQIRVHSKSIGHPIVGDHLYGGTNPDKKKFEDNFFGHPSKPPSKGDLNTHVRHLLHAKSITFLDPTTGELTKVECPIPKDFNIKLLK